MPLFTTTCCVPGGCHDFKQCCVYNTLLLLTNHSIASQNEYPVTDHMFWSLCLCFTVHNMYVYRQLKLHLLPVLCYVCVVMWVFFWSMWVGNFPLDSYWCSCQTLTPLLWFHICCLCAHLICTEHLGLVWCSTMLWQAESQPWPLK